MQEQVSAKNQAKTMTVFEKEADKVKAVEFDNLPPWETIKRNKDQEARRIKLERNEEIFSKIVVPMNDAKARKKDELVSKYMRQRESRFVEEDMRKS